MIFLDRADSEAYKREASLILADRLDAGLPAIPNIARGDLDRVVQLKTQLECAATQLALVARELRLAFASSPASSEVFHDLVSATEFQSRRAAEVAAKGKQP